MLNFTEEIKNEITSSPVTSEGARAILSAFILTSGNIMLKNDFYGFELVTENERTAEFFLNILWKLQNLRTCRHSHLFYN